MTTKTRKSTKLQGVPSLGISKDCRAYGVRIDWTTAPVVQYTFTKACTIPVIEAAILHGTLTEGKHGDYHIEAGETIYFTRSSYGNFYYLARWNGHHYCCSCPSGGVRGSCHHDTDVAAYVASREAAASQKEAAAEEETRVEYGCHHDKGLDKYEPMYRINGGQWEHYLGEDGEPISIMGYWECQQYLRIVRKSSQMEADMWYQSLAVQVAA